MKKILTDGWNEIGGGCNALASSQQEHGPDPDEVRKYPVFQIR